MDERKDGYYFFKFLGDDEWTIIMVTESHVGLFYDADGYGISYKDFIEGEWGDRITLPHEVVGKSGRLPCGCPEDGGCICIRM